ncbi:6-N-hydroxylaminopurine resistance protein [Rubripirellula lacrimiformis]|uniref:6-N-hydroxylaminopurine resistance protein n=1 Tax=Rubripirellula lacrimiformis TaxID=1930273 RepID=A0A517N3J4_9BACT|nr:MOSC domain-containing protein [Rubripirellula lacrimiformis]QDT01705.1 6-N-hydroxylaminopurine resistance protein [Rubripirellula lacrimiformis]
MTTLVSIQRGRVVTEGDAESADVTTRLWTSAFHKTPVDGPVEMTPLGVVGDAVANTQSHGGPDKAVLCYAAAHYSHWGKEFPSLAMSGGAMGENLTIDGWDESNVCIGDRFAVGDCEIEIAQPRQPCWKIVRRWGEKTLLKRVTQSGRTGWYARVTAGGTITAGVPVTLTMRKHPDWTVARVNDLYVGREVDRMAIIELMKLPELADAWKQDIA